MWVSDSFRKTVLLKKNFKDDVNLRGSASYECHDNGATKNSN